ncbi:TRAP transporter substrate-binding protein DctP [Shimia sp. R9_3]|uniref:TRAP transporter substrate-binding protein n=1 Tax=Shimia sp. R9_3 TaxID=2821113 RepID=UPI001ADC11D5|nr:TRAP transporter substrate-binding protein DctP [Shimia sp. R9_3]MBO9401497.1 TRAP transporter substrate-binding protein [Shimia sp. R9_3]
MKFTKFATTCALALGVMSSTALAETTLKLATVAPLSSPWGQWAQGVAKKIEEESGGEMKIEVIGDAQLGDEQTILRQGMKGRVDLVLVSNIPLSLIGQEMDLVSSPFLYDSVEQGSCVAFNHLSEILGPSLREARLEPLTWMEVGNYIVFSKDEARTPSALEGRKVRVAATTADELFARKIGAVGVPMGTSDTIPALQTGNVEAAFLPGVFGIAIGTHKVAPNVTVSNHTRLIGTVAVSQRSYNKLSDQEKEWLSAFTEGGAALSAAVLGAEGALLGKLEGAGLPVARLSDEEAAEWRASADGLREELAEQLGPKAVSILEQINAAKVACGS